MFTSPIEHFRKIGKLFQNEYAANAPKPHQPINTIMALCLVATCCPMKNMILKQNQLRTTVFVSQRAGVSLESWENISRMVSSRSHDGCPLCLMYLAFLASARACAKFGNV